MNGLVLRCDLMMCRDVNVQLPCGSVFQSKRGKKIKVPWCTDGVERREAEVDLGIQE